jgi:hypothetical protein
VAGEAPRTAFAATWRNQGGEIVGTTYGGTMCRFPIKPWRIRFHRDGFEGVIPCGECPGCLEFYRRRLAARFHEKYGTDGEFGSNANPRLLRGRRAKQAAPSISLFAVRIYAPLELHAEYSRRWHRRPRLQLEPGFVRCGSRSFFLITRAPIELLRVLSRIGLRFRSHRILLRRGARAWRALSAGLIVSRAVYGEQRNRWYARGLPEADRQKWEVRKVAKYQTYDRSSSPRAWSGRGLVLVPPEVWKLQRADRRALRSLLMRTPDPEGVRRVMGLVAGVLSGRGGEGRSDEDRIRDTSSTASREKKLASNFLATAEGRSGRRHSAKSYQKIAELRPGTASPVPGSENLPPFSEMGGYVSSEHDQGELMPEQLAAAERKAWREGRKVRVLQESLEIIERIRKKTLGEK